MKASDIDEGRRLRAALDAKQRILEEWTGPKKMNGAYGPSSWESAIQDRDDLTEDMNRWIADHSEELLNIALGPADVATRNQIGTGFPQEWTSATVRFRSDPRVRRAKGEEQDDIGVRIRLENGRSFFVCGHEWEIEEDTPT